MAIRSTHRSGLAALAGAILAMHLSGPVRADQPGPSPIVSLLFEQARMWRERNRLDLAEQSLRKVIESQPDNLEALFQLGLLDLQRQDLDKVRATVARLQQLNPADPRAEELKRAMILGQPDEASVAEARRLAAAGQFDRAIAAYRRAFRGGPPPYDLATEYYETLAGSGAGWEEARLGLKALAERSYASPRLRYVYARVLTYNESTRREGIRRLSELVADPAFGQTALEAMRQAMLWLAVAPADRPFYESYVQRFPGDTAMRDKLAELTRPAVIDPTSQALGEAYRLADAKQLEQAASRFEAILKSSPTNADAMAGLGIVRLQQERFEAARDLLTRAVAAAPDRQRDWAQALESATFWTSYREALAARDRGDFAQAEKIARPLVDRAGSAQPVVEAFLGEVLRRQGRPREAEEAFRAALRGDANNKEAQVGLYQVLVAQGRDPRAEPMLATLDSTTQARLRGDGSRQAADRLRADAKAADRSGSPRADELYQQALRANPGDPWLRYDYATYLARTGQEARAAALVEELAASQQAEGLFAAAVYYAERQRSAEAIALLDRIPPGQRSARMNALRNDLSVASQTDALVAAARSGDAAARQALIARANAAQATPAQAAASALALAQIGERAQAIAIVRRLMSRTDLSPAVARQLFYAAAEAGADAEANALLARAGRGAAGTDAANLRETLAIRQADRVREQGNTAAAYDALAPYVAGAAPSVGSRLALARVYKDAHYTTEAMQVLESVMASPPVTPETLQEAVNIAIGLGQLNRAQAWLTAGLQAQPDNPHLYLVQARLLRAKGDMAGARRALETAQQLNMGGRRSDASSTVKPAVVPVAAARDVAGDSGDDAASADSPADVTAYVAAALSRRMGEDRGAMALLPQGGSDGDPPAAAAPPARRAAAPAAAPYVAVTPVAARSATPAGGSLAAPPGTYVAQAPVVAQAYPTVAQGYPAVAGAPIVPLRRPGGAPVAPIETAPAAPGSVGSDPLSREIAREYEALQRETAKSIDAGFQFRGRSGETGMGRLNDLSVPVKGRIPIGTGALTMAVTPVSIDAGSVDSSTGALRRFGTNQLQPAAGVRDPGGQSDKGIGLGIGAEWGRLSADVGSTPLGFTRTNIVGGVSWTQPLGDKMRLKVEGSRRPVTDSVLSYAATRDPATGQVWGAVTRMGGEAVLSYDDGEVGWFTKAAYGVYDGKNVARNTSYEMTAGAYFRPYKDTTSELRIGASGTYLSYDKNLGEFTFGHGGYFSPQNFYSLSFPVDWSEKTGKFSYFLGGTIGVQNVQKSAIGYFPGHSDLQAAADAIAAVDPTRPSSYGRSNVTSLGFALRAGFEYTISDRFTLGGRANFESSKEYDQGTVLLFLRHAFN